MADAQSTPDKRTEILTKLRAHSGCEDEYGCAILGPALDALRVEVEAHVSVLLPGGWICDDCSVLLEPGDCCGAIKRIHSALFPTPLQKEPVMR
jgi:hypothetical protein